LNGASKPLFVLGGVVENTRLLSSGLIHFIQLCATAEESTMLHLLSSAVCHDNDLVHSHSLNSQRSEMSA